MAENDRAADEPVHPEAGGEPAGGEDRANRTWGRREIGARALALAGFAVLAINSDDPSRGGITVPPGGGGGTGGPA